MLQKLLLLFLGILLPLFLLEVLLRIITQPTSGNKYIYDQMLGHRRKPNFSGVYSSPEYFVNVEYNSHGFRDVEHNLENEKKCYRIAFLGDSYIEGIQVDRSELITSVLEKQIASYTTRCVEVMNFGISGFGTAQEYLLLESEVIKYSPSAVILGLLPGNDIRNNSIKLDQATSDYSFAQRPYFSLENNKLELHPPTEAARVSFERRGWRYKIFDNSALLKFLHQRLTHVDAVANLMVRFGFLSKSTLLLTRGVPTDYNIYLPELDNEWKNAWEITEILLGKFKKLLTSKNIPLLVVVIPSREQIYSQDWQEILDTYPDMKNKKWDLEYPNKRLNDYLQYNKIEAIDLLGIFNKHSLNPERINYKLDGHWTSFGHKIAAEAISGKIVEMNWLGTHE